MTTASTFAGPPALLAMCFGMCLPVSYGVPLAGRQTAPLSGKSSAPSRPTTNWREIPLLAKYELLKQIGKGGFSEIWLCENRATREMVAIKVVQLANADLEAEEVATLLSEAKYLRTLDCPYLLRCFETAATEDWLLMVLEYLAGGEMLDHIHKVKRYTEAEAGKLFAQVVSAVSYLHNLNIIHRDIKPENIMFAAPVEVCEAEGRPLRVKVIDLGMAALYDAGKELRGCIGTPGFVAPELWNDGPHTPACDIYSLGVVLFIMLTGRKPHSGADIRNMTYCNKSIKDAVGLQDERFLSLSPAARELLLAMLADDPRVRPTAQQVLRHDFIAAVDASSQAHREMGEVVRRRMRDLAQLRRVHGLRFALRVQKPSGADHQTFLEALEQRRLKLKGQAGSFVRASEVHPFGRASQPDGVPSFARTSLHHCYAAPHAATPPAPSQAETAAHGGAAPAAPGAPAPPSGPASSPLAVAPGRPANGITSPPHIASPFARASSGPNSASTPHASRAPASAPSHAARPPGAAAPPPPPGAAPSGEAAASSAEARAQPRSPAVAWPPDEQEQQQLLLQLAGAPSLPDSSSRDLGQPVPSSLAARRPPLLPPIDAAYRVRTSHTGYGGGGGGGGGSNYHDHDHHRNHQQLAIDPMMLVNALPALQHCPSMPVADAAPGVGLGLGLGPGGERLDGGSPVATAEVLEQALLSKCMSANPYTLELLAHHDTLTHILERDH